MPFTKEAIEQNLVEDHELMVVADTLFRKDEDLLPSYQFIHDNHPETLANAISDPRTNLTLIVYFTASGDFEAVKFHDLHEDRFKSDDCTVMFICEGPDDGPKKLYNAQPLNQVTWTITRKLNQPRYKDPTIDCTGIKQYAADFHEFCKGRKGTNWQTTVSSGLPGPETPRIYLLYAIAYFRKSESQYTILHYPRHESPTQPEIQLSAKLFKDDTTVFGKFLQFKTITTFVEFRIIRAANGYTLHTPTKKITRKLAHDILWQLEKYIATAANTRQPKEPYDHCMELYKAGCKSTSIDIDLLRPRDKDGTTEISLNSPGKTPVKTKDVKSAAAAHDHLECVSYAPTLPTNQLVTPSQSPQRIGTTKTHDEAPLYGLTIEAKQQIGFVPANYEGREIESQGVVLPDTPQKTIYPTSRINVNAFYIGINYFTRTQKTEAELVKIIHTDQLSETTKADLEHQNMIPGELARIYKSGHRHFIVYKPVLAQHMIKLAADIVDIEEDFINANKKNITHVFTLIEGIASAKANNPTVYYYAGFVTNSGKNNYLIHSHANRKASTATLTAATHFLDIRYNEETPPIQRIFELSTNTTAYMDYSLLCTIIKFSLGQLVVPETLPPLKLGGMIRAEIEDSEVAEKAYTMEDIEAEKASTPERYTPSPTQTDRDEATPDGGNRPSKAKRALNLAYETDPTRLTFMLHGACQWVELQNVATQTSDDKSHAIFIDDQPHSAELGRYYQFDDNSAYIVGHLLHAEDLSAGYTQLQDKLKRSSLINENTSFTQTFIPAKLCQLLDPGAIPGDTNPEEIVLIISSYDQEQSLQDPTTILLPKHASAALAQALVDRQFKLSCHHKPATVETCQDSDFIDCVHNRLNSATSYNQGDDNEDAGPAEDDRPKLPDVNALIEIASTLDVKLKTGHDKTTELTSTPKGRQKISERHTPSKTPKTPKTPDHPTFSPRKALTPNSLYRAHKSLSKIWKQNAARIEREKNLDRTRKLEAEFTQDNGRTKKQRLAQIPPYPQHLRRSHTSTKVIAVNPHLEKPWYKRYWPQIGITLLGIAVTTSIALATCGFGLIPTFIGYCITMGGAAMTGAGVGWTIAQKQNEADEPKTPPKFHKKKPPLGENYGGNLNEIWERQDDGTEFRVIGNNIRQTKHTDNTIISVYSEGEIDTETEYPNGDKQFLYVNNSIKYAYKYGFTRFTSVDGEIIFYDKGQRELTGATSLITLPNGIHIIRYKTRTSEYFNSNGDRIEECEPQPQDDGTSIISFNDNSVLTVYQNKMWCFKAADGATTFYDSEDNKIEGAESLEVRPDGLTVIHLPGGGEKPYGADGKLSEPAGPFSNVVQQLTFDSAPPSPDTAKSTVLSHLERVRRQKNYGSTESLQEEDALPIKLDTEHDADSLNSGHDFDDDAAIIRNDNKEVDISIMSGCNRLEDTIDEERNPLARSASHSNLKFFKENPDHNPTALTRGGKGNDMFDTTLYADPFEPCPRERSKTL